MPSAIRAPLLVPSQSTLRESPVPAFLAQGVPCGSVTVSPHVTGAVSRARKVNVSWTPSAFGEKAAGAVRLASSRLPVEFALWLGVGVAVGFGVAVGVGFVVGLGLGLGLGVGVAVGVGGVHTVPSVPATVASLESDMSPVMARQNLPDPASGSI